MPAQEALPGHTFACEGEKWWGAGHFEGSGVISHCKSFLICFFTREEDSGSGRIGGDIAGLLGLYPDPGTYSSF